MISDNAPAGAAAVVHAALATVATATGLRLVDDGTTTEQPNADRPAYQPKRYGDRWAPVLISFATATGGEGFDNAELGGLGGSAAVTDPAGRAIHVTGDIQLARSAFDHADHGVQTPAVQRTIVLHELGHLMGLAHVNDPTQIMNPSIGSVTEYGAGDLAGLALLGRNPCAPQV